MGVSWFSLIGLVWLYIGNVWLLWVIGIVFDEDGEEGDEVIFMNGLRVFMNFFM